MAGNRSDIQNFGARMARSYNLAPPTHYSVQFTPPGSFSLFSSVNNVVENLRLNDSLESVIFPGRGQNTAVNKTHGPVRDIPYEPLFSGEIEMSFRVSSDYFERDYFERWSNAIIDPQTMKYKYYSNYTANMKIQTLDVFENVIYECEVYECYPKSITPISLSYSQVGEVTRFSVSMAFRKYVAYTPGSKPVFNNPVSSFEGPLPRERSPEEAGFAGPQSPQVPIPSGF